MSAAIVAGAACPKNPDLLLGFVKKIVWRWGVRIAVDEQGREWLISRRRGVRLVEAFEIVDEVVCGVPAPVVRPLRAVSPVSDSSRGALAAPVGCGVAGQGISTAMGLGLSPSTERGRVAARPQRVSQSPNGSLSDLSTSQRR